MRNAIRTRFYSLAILALLGQTCAEDKEEYVDEDQNYVETMYGTTKKEAQSDWEKFHKKSLQAISVTETNLSGIEMKVNGTTSNVDKQVLEKILTSGRLQLNALKSRLARRDLEFRAELKHYEKSSSIRNNEFRNDFLKDLQALNNELESILGEDD